MSEMVARVARAIFDDIRKDSLSSDVERWALVASVGMARAAIAAMREPTEAMIAAGEMEMYEYMAEPRDWTHQNTANAWRAMIETALK